MADLLPRTPGHDAARRVRAGLCPIVLGHPLYVWLLWAAAAAVLAACPMMLSDPAMWLYVADPELLALVVIVGVRYSRVEIAILGTRTRMRLRLWRAINRLFCGGVAQFLCFCAPAGDELRAAAGQEA